MERKSTISPLAKTKNVVKLLCWIGIVANLVSIPFNHFQQTVSYLPELIGFTLFFLSAVLAIKFGHTRLATHIFYFTAALEITYSCIVEGYEGLGFLLLFPLALSTVPLFDKRSTMFDQGLAMISIGFGVVTVMFLFLGDHQALNPIQGNELKATMAFNFGISIALFVAVLYVIIRSSKGRLKALEQFGTEREILLAEMNHRVKNNMAVISGIMSLQAHKANSEVQKELFNDARSRIHSMATVHTLLYRHESFDSMRIDLLIQSLIDEMEQIYTGIRSATVQFKCPAAEVPLTFAVPISLIINEVLSNAYKYGWVNDRELIILLDVRATQEQLSFVMQDNGPGLLAPEKLTESDGIGMVLIRSLSEQIDANFEFTNNEGLRFELSVPHGQQTQN